MSGEYNPQAQDGFGLGVAGIYAGGVQWGVRWAEGAMQPRIDTCQDEEDARGLLRHFQQRHEKWPDQSIKPELVAARVHWAVQQ